MAGVPEDNFVEHGDPFIWIALGDYTMRGQGGLVLTCRIPGRDGEFRRHWGAPSGRPDMTQIHDIVLYVSKLLMDAVACRGGVQEVLPAT
jgi:hypothetical protein